jgi:hypothetical protein
MMTCKLWELEIFFRGFCRKSKLYHEIVGSDAFDVFYRSVVTQ